MQTIKCVKNVFQFAVLMWLLTYVGALFNGLTLLILGEVTTAVVPEKQHVPATKIIQWACAVQLVLHLFTFPVSTR